MGGQGGGDLVGGQGALRVGAHGAAGISQRRPMTRQLDYDMKYFNQRDEVAFALAEAGDASSPQALLRITQNDPDAAKRERAMGLLKRLGG